MPPGPLPPAHLAGVRLGGASAAAGECRREVAGDGEPDPAPVRASGGATVGDCARFSAAETVTETRGDAGRRSAVEIVTETPVGYDAAG